MAKNGSLVIVESPTKARSIGRILGDGYVVEASYGHVRDLPKSKLGVDLETFQPEYVVPPDAKKRVAGIAKLAKSAGTVYLATDLDREGEAIAWHVLDAAKIPLSKARRVTFHEITPAAVRDAFKKPRAIDENLVNAQQARRVLDRLVGYKISPLLWRKIRYGLSAGRVQSVALRLVVDREREIQAFVAEEYWSIAAVLETLKGEIFTAELLSHHGHRIKIGNEADANKHRAALTDAAYSVAEIEKKEVHKNAAPSFTTSTLQQEASRKLGFSVKRTMVIAQQLYEGVELGDQGQVGLITYMRTDSVHVAESALRQTRDVIVSEFGEPYALAHPRHYKTRSKGAQEAHEAIRPTDSSHTPNAVRHFLSREQLRLYTLIWQRHVASQMAPALLERTRIDVGADGYVLRATGQKVAFDGYRRVYQEGTDDPEKEESPLPDVQPDDRLMLRGLDAQQHFTQPPPRYTEASLVKTLEENGIGRPSTYAPTISTLIARKYVVLEQRRLVPQDVGFVVTDFLKEHFPGIVDLSFTAHMEEDLDRIAGGEAQWVPVVREFFEPFIKLVEEKDRAIEKKDIVEEATDKVCPEGHPMVIKLGRFGKFLSCSKYPEHKYRESLGEKPKPEIIEGEVCPDCGSPLARKRGRYGPFIGCTNYPNCKYVKKEAQSTGVQCPQCTEGELVRRRGRGGKFFYGCSRYPKCDYTTWTRPAGAKSPAEAGDSEAVPAGTQAD
ncbi:MAG: type I DNA topoisomerase [Chloroflexi bacterium]|nr:MAG: type I DNA topoisomerase [Chloroflexota bacterium]